MSILETLVFSETSKKAEKSTPHLMLRQKLIAAIDDQINCFNAEQNNQHFSRQVQKTVKNAETGEKSRHTIERPIRKMWWKSSGGILIELRFANKVLKVGKGSIVVSELSDLVPTFQKIQQAIRNGELDELMQKTLEGRKRAKKDGKPVAANSPKPEPTVAATVGKPVNRAAK